MTTITGKWNIVTASPIGKQKLALELTVAETALSGTARNDAEFVELKKGSVDGNTAKFEIDLKKPLPLTIAYTLHFDGDAVTGTAKAGFFPTSSVEGVKENA